ncbi:RRM3 [Candida jiufengensis]|uniref:RRM3 n=1 Tax=Candida jiufengensis TaxID=497108 RepID=UPI00222589C6|nr:RRM3 [Candida jiufengensis]KAI5950864.1 RRM3 [Candida jiufengensis]
MSKKKTSIKLPVGQRAISDFYICKNNNNNNFSNSFSKKQPDNLFNRIPSAKRQSSILSTTTDNDDDDDEGFGDGHDISIDPDTSSEMTNFRDPKLYNVLQSKFNSPMNSQLSRSNSILNEKSANELNHEIIPPALKRSNTDILDSFDGGKAKKILKQSSIQQTQVEIINNDDLSPEQMEIIDKVVNKKLNVFYTGSAGTGKSVVLRALVKRLKAIYRDNIGVTAPTGMAACNINGQTIFRYLEIGLGLQNPNELAKMIQRNPGKLRKWTMMKVLIIDEISMVDGHFFDKLEETARKVRGNSAPFGGIQIVCCGDFYQLPPVSTRGKEIKFCFQAKSWNLVIQENIVLKQIFRQKGDNELIEMLNALRTGDVRNQPDMIDKFKKLTEAVKYDDGLEPTQLFPTRKEVLQANNGRLQKLESKVYEYTAVDSHVGEMYKNHYAQLLCEDNLILKEGAQVMNIKNMGDTLANGTLGTILFFITKNLFFKLMDLYGSFESLDPQSLKEIRLLSSRIGIVQEWSTKEKEIFDSIPNERKSKFESLIQYTAQETKAEMLPVVLYKLNGMDEARIVDREEFVIELGKEKSSTGNPTRVQLPIILSWAMSIHKAQGQTIPRLKVDLDRIFENGHAYVAISRAVSKNCLQIKHFRADKIRVSKEVHNFYKSLESRTSRS